MASEVESIENFKEVNGKIADIVREELNDIKNAIGKDQSRNGLYNIGIVYNNKIMELIHMYHKHDVEFFNENSIAYVVLTHLKRCYYTALGYLEKYHNENLVGYYEGQFLIKTPGRKELQHYKAQTENIFDFDITKDLPNVIAGFYQHAIENPIFGVLFYNDFDNIKSNMINELTELRLFEIIPDCEKEMDYCYELITNMINELGIDIKFDSSDTPPNLS